ncbi:Sugar transporter STL1 [Saccharomyces cerevisiae S288c] [Rhizoctonia solani]|uniref:Sugar transporter STL1 [Saccharomyces cerevisiae S288c] n=1 Tax=Rhizoctonia solani TaxID=456999 RepID=A0A0K6GD86_9AGAM|nr:Sugar transporter STL1 [Saccharomyces cerevisiae S288c] [Rhizoctonia solani]
MSSEGVFGTVRALEGQALLTMVTTLTASGFMLIGYDVGVLGGLIENESFKRSFNYPSPALLGTIVAVLEIGCFLGSLLTVAFGEQVGRRGCTSMGAIAMLVGTIFQTASQSSTMMIISRVISGIGLGIINSTVPVLQAEFSPKAARGFYVCIQLTVLNLGIMLAYWVDFVFSSHHSFSSAQWRIPLALQLVFIIPMFLISWLIIPESPRWLAAHGRTDEAKAILRRLYNAPPVNDQPPEADMMFNAIMDTVNFDKQFGSENWKDVIRLFYHDDMIKSRRRLLIACTIQAFQQLGGVNSIVYYASFLFVRIGFSVPQSNLLSGGLFTWFFVASFIPWVLIDTIGRRKLLLACVPLMSIVFYMQAGFIYQSQVDIGRDVGAGIAACIMVFVYMGLFTVGFQAVVWVYPSEILPLRLRATGSALSTATNWLCNYLVVQITPVAISTIKFRTYIIFGIVNTIFVPIVYFTFPETKGLSLEEIDELFSLSGHTASEISP